MRALFNDPRTYGLDVIVAIAFGVGIFIHIWWEIKKGLIQMYVKEFYRADHPIAFWFVIAIQLLIGINLIVYPIFMLWSGKVSFT